MSRTSPKKPTKIKIFGNYFPVINNYEFEEPQTFGAWKGTHGLIQISKDCPEHTYFLTLIHEIFEATLDRADLEIPHPTLTLLAEAVVQVLRDNPELVSLI